MKGWREVDFRFFVAGWLSVVFGLADLYVFNYATLAAKETYTMVAWAAAPLILLGLILLGFSYVLPALANQDRPKGELGAG